MYRIGRCSLAEPSSSSMRSLRPEEGFSRTPSQCLCGFTRPTARRLARPHGWKCFASRAECYFRTEQEYCTGICTSKRAIGRSHSRPSQRYLGQSVQSVCFRRNFFPSILKRKIKKGEEGFTLRKSSSFWLSILLPGNRTKQSDKL